MARSSHVQHFRESTDNAKGASVLFAPKIPVITVCSSIPLMVIRASLPRSHPPLSTGARKSSRLVPDCRGTIIGKQNRALRESTASHHPRHCRRKEEHVRIGEIPQPF